MNIENPTLKRLAQEHPEVKMLIDEIDSYHSNPEKIFYLELKEIILTLTDEMKSVRFGNKGDCVLLTSEDKLFERIKSLLTDSEKIFNGLRKGAGESEDEPKNNKKKGSQVAI